MKMKLKSKLIALFVLLASLFILGGCSVGESLEEIIADRGLVARVTYYANGGTFNGTPEKKEMYYPEGAKAIDIGNEDISITSGTVKIERNDYDFAGWYYAVLDSEGKPELNADKSYKLGEKVDFSQTLTAGDHWHVVAKWATRVQLVFKLVADKGETITNVPVKEDAKEETFENGDIVLRRSYSLQTNAVSRPQSPFTVKNKTHTFLEYYMEETCENIVSWPYYKKDNQTEDEVIYAKYIKGDWNIVKDGQGVHDMFTYPEKNYWIFQDIVATDVQVEPVANFTGTIKGNNHTISNLSVVKAQVRSEKHQGMFGNIKAGANIENITFSNVTMRYTTKESNIHFAFAFTSIETGATIDNVTIQGKMTVEKSGDSEYITAGNYGVGYAENGQFGFTLLPIPKADNPAENDVLYEII